MWRKIGVCVVVGTLASASGCIFDTDDDDEDTDDGAAVQGDGEVDVKVTDDDGK
jgi:hypothetical protein